MRPTITRTSSSSSTSASPRSDLDLLYVSMATSYRSRSRKAQPRSVSRKISAGRKARMSLVPRGPKTFTLSRTWYGGNWSPVSTATTGFWRYLSFGLANLPSYQDFTNIFDEYRFDSIKVLLRPRFDGFVGNDSTDTAPPAVTNGPSTQVNVIIDPGSNVVPSGTYSSGTFNSFLENGKVVSYQGNKAVTFTIRRPTVDNQLFLGTSKMVSPWISTSDSASAHKGAHVFMSDVNLTGFFYQSYDLFYTYNLSFRGMK